MTQFTVRLGDEIDYGTFEAVDMDDALIAALTDSDHTREYKIELLSNSTDFGRPSSVMSCGAGNGGQPTQDWFYVRGKNSIGIYKTSDSNEE